MEQGHECEGPPSQGPEHEGVVEQVLPRGLFRVHLDDGRRITAAFSAQARQVTVGVRPGDRVTVALSSFDPTRGRITVRHR